MNFLAISNSEYIKTKNIKTPYIVSDGLISSIVYINQRVNKDGSCTLDLSTEEKIGRHLYVCTQLKDGTLVLATAAHDIGLVDQLRAINSVYLNGKYMRIAPNVNSTDKIAGVYNRTVAELTLDDLRGVTYIPGQGDNTYLKKVEIPFTVASISYQGLWCPNLEEVLFEENSHCTSIGEMAFGRGKCKKIEFPDSVQTIGGNQFLEHTTIEYVTLGVSIRSIGSGFLNKNHKNFKGLILKKKCVTQDDVSTLGSALTYGTVYVPDETTQTLLQNTTNWSASTIKLISELPEGV